MRSLPKPNIISSETISLCASSIRNKDLKDRLKLTEPAVKAAESDYQNHGEASTLYQITAAKGIGTLITDKEMERVYNNTFVTSVKTRNLYAMIKNACVNDKCPLCAQGTVGQLDHYLPISEFSVLGLTALNLVPACGDCNKIKLTYAPQSANEQLLHPYFDQIEERWLYGEVIETTPPSIRFFAAPPSGWDAIKSDRIRKHFDFFKLNKLYKSQAAEEMINIRYALRILAQKRNACEEIRADLLKRAKSCADVYQNSWQRATYDALANSDWFCSGGFDSF